MTGLSFSSDNQDCWRLLTENRNPGITGVFREPRKGGKFHNGLDLAVKTGTPVYAMRDGVVYEVRGSLETGSGYIDHPLPKGNFVRINNDDGTQSVYLHLQKFKEKDLPKGTRVAAGQQIGKANNTGSSAGPHLHYTIYRDTSSRKIENARDPQKVHGDC